MMKWLKNLFGGSDSSSEPAEPAAAPEPQSMPAEAPPAQVETPTEASASGDEPGSASEPSQPA